MKTARTLLLAVLVAPVAFAEPIAIRGDRVVIGDGRVIEHGTVLVDGERIVAVGGAEVAVPAGAREIRGAVVWPGMIDPFTTLGLAEVLADRATNDANEATSTSTAALRASDGIDADSTPIAVTRIAGVTTALVAPGTRNPINGTAAIVDLAGRTTDDMLVADEVALVLNLAATRESSYPTTRPGAVAFIRQSLIDAQAYDDKRRPSGGPAAAGAKRAAKGKGDDEKQEPPALDLGKEPLARALRGEIAVIALAPKANDIRSALALAREFKLRLALAGAGEAWKMAGDIAAAGVPVLLGETFAEPEEREPYDRCYRLGAALHAAGVRVAFTTRSSHGVRTLSDHAAMAATYGLPLDAAVTALTLEPARILGIDRDRGSLEPGRIANVVVWNGDPLRLTTRVEHVLIRGREIELRSRQEALRDRWQRLDDVR